MQNNKLANKIVEEIKKSARTREGYNNKEIEFDKDEDIELVIDGEKKKCRVWLLAEYSYYWYEEMPTYWEPGDREIKKLDIWIKDIGIEPEDGTVYSREKEKQILDENREVLTRFIEDDITDAAYNDEWEED